MRNGTPEIGHRIDVVLSEFRIIVPGLAALLGFQLTVAFTEAFTDTPDLERWVHIAAVFSNVAAIVFLLIPPSYNRFAPGAEATEEFLRYVVRAVSNAFFFIAATLALSLYVQAWRITSSRGTALLLAGTAAVGVALAWWVFPAIRARRKHAEHRRQRAS